MAILDRKTRILDSIITNVGKKQLSIGNFKPTFYSFSDSGVVYSFADKFVSGAFNKEKHLETILSLEAVSKIEDQITTEVDDNGKLIIKNLSSSIGSLTVYGDGIFVSGTMLPLSNSIDLKAVVSSASIDNFSKHFILGSRNIITDEYENFSASQNNIVFTLTPSKPLEPGVQYANINNVESLPFDRRLNHVPNYKFLSPINKINKIPIGNYSNIKTTPIISLNDILKEVSGSINNGFSKTINFQDGLNSRWFVQMFEFAGPAGLKLDLIDYGSFETRNDDGINTKHVVYAGKLLKDDNGSDTFICLFTLIFE
jgi:hypothetical protein